MFGSNTGSSWTNPQGNQQQAGAFGQPSGFGAGNAFGSAPNANAFGQPQQQQQQPQQPQANPMFGGLGGTSATTSSTGFGAFGGAANNTANTGGLFGQPKPTTGFGTFGSTGATNTFGTPAAGAFGTTNSAGPSAGGGPFGQASQPSTSTNAFGGGGGLFGAKPATAFGGATTTATMGAPAPVTTGSATPPYAPYLEKDGSNASLTLHYHSITCMPQYRGSSFEELRVQDYQQGRKTASAAPTGGFGQTAYGASAQPQQQPQQQSTGLFGQPAQNNAAPASNPIFGSFGNTNNSATNAGTAGAFGAFGQPQNNTTTTGTGLFGSGGAFGQQSQQQQQQQQQPQQQSTTAFGAFGQPQQQPTTGSSLFGSGGAFGANNQQKPTVFGAFGTPGATGAFGQPQNQQQQQQQPVAGTGLFGQPAQQQQNTGAFGAMGTNNAPKPGLFGQSAQANTGLGLFGQPNQQQQQQQPAQTGGGLFGTNNNTGSSLFGNTNNQQQPQQQQQGTGLFGQPAQQPATGGALFGGGGGLFGNNNQNQQQQQQQHPAQNTGFGLFGASKPAAPQGTSGGLFGNAFGQPGQNTTQPNTNQLFGSTLGQPANTQQNTNAFASGGLFGNRPSAPLGAAPSTGQQGNALGGSLFGNGFGQSINNMNMSSLGQSAQPQLTASIAQPVSMNLPIFSMLPPGPRSIPLDQPKKKSNYFADIPTRTPLPRLGLNYTPAVSKLRGFTSTSQGPGANSTNSNVLFGSSKPNALSLSKASNGKSTLGTDTYLTGGSSSPTLGTGGRKSFKKLILDKRVEPADLLNKSSVMNASRITFSPALSVAAREKEAAAATNRASPAPRVHDSPSPAPQRQRAHNRFTADALNAGSNAISPQEDAVGELREGDYWVTPDLETLKRMSHGELVCVTGLAVGRKGYGVVTFLEPVDLTNVPKLAGLLGDLVRFDDKECSVYPDSDEAEKPPPGSGLNVEARIELYRCWALDKATREPIKDEKDPHAVRHLKRLKNMKHTRFESFDIAEGKWTFTVDHF